MEDSSSFQKSLAAHTHFLPLDDPAQFEASLPANSEKLIINSTLLRQQYKQDLEQYNRLIIQQTSAAGLQNPSQRRQEVQADRLQLTNGSSNQFLGMGSVYRPPSKLCGKYIPEQTIRKQISNPILEREQYLITGENKSGSSQQMLLSLDHNIIRQLLKQQSITLMKQGSQAGTLKNESGVNNLSTASTQEEWGKAQSVIKGLESLLN